MSYEIYYFTGTGNSLAIANELKLKLGGAEVIPIVPLMKNEKSEIKLGKKVGFVFPVYYLSFPKIALEFLERLDLSETEYIFLIANRGVMNVGGFAGNILKHLPACIDHTNEIFTKYNRKLDSAFYIDMPFNDPTWSELPQEELEWEKLINMKFKVEQIVKIIREQSKHYDIEPIKFMRKIRSAKFVREVNEKDREFRVTSSCNACGICENICPVDNIIIKEKQPVWQHHCQQCLACLNYCPKCAVEYGEKTKGRRRYTHPEITLREIIGQKKYRK